jgi:hypothetical protein
MLALFNQHIEDIRYGHDAPFYHHRMEPIFDSIGNVWFRCSLTTHDGDSVVFLRGKVW